MSSVRRRELLVIAVLWLAVVHASAQFATSAPKRPQHPQKPYPYGEEDVTYENKPAGIKIAATLTLPRGKGRFPAVLLITGSGQQDRDETILGHKPFLVLADYLTRRGIAVLRADDRGIGGTSAGDLMNATTADFAQDVTVGVRYLKSRKEIDPKRIGLLGHSEGGIIAPIVAARNPRDVAFIVMLAGSGVTGEEVLYRQGELILKAEKQSEQIVAAQRKLQERMFAVIKNEKDRKLAEPKLREAAKSSFVDFPEPQRNALQASIEAQVRMFNLPWTRYFVTYDPAIALRYVQCPVLALNGERDLQVPPKENLEAIAKALKAAGNKDVTVKLLPKLNHLFQTCETGALSEYARIEETMAPEALRLIADWIVRHAK